LQNTRVYRIDKLLAQFARCFVEELQEECIGALTTVLVKIELGHVQAVTFDEGCRLDVWLGFFEQGVLGLVYVEETYVLWDVLST
jgi:hypothetical protein